MVTSFATALEIVKRDHPLRTDEAIEALAEKLSLAWTHHEAVAPGIVERTKAALLAAYPRTEDNFKKRAINWIADRASAQTRLRRESRWHPTWSR